MIEKCLAGTDIDECKIFMENNTIWDKAQADVKQMNPDIYD